MYLLLKAMNRHLRRKTGIAAKTVIQISERMAICWLAQRCRIRADLIRSFISVAMKIGDAVKIKPDGAWTGLNRSMRVIKNESGVFWLSPVHFLEGREIRMKTRHNKICVGVLI